MGEGLGLGLRVVEHTVVLVVLSEHSIDRKSGR
jgi:hypothetical protein